MFCHYWYFKDVGFKFERHVCNKYHDVLIAAQKLETIAIFTVKAVDCRFTLWNINKNEAVSVYKYRDKCRT